MRPTLIAILALAGCQGILGIPSEGQLGCPDPRKVAVCGRTVHAESLGESQPALANVTVELTSVDPSQKVITEDGGTYEFADLEPSTPIAFRMSLPQSAPNDQGLLDTFYVVRTPEREDIVLDLPVVQYDWLAKVAFQCGIFASPEEALFQPGTTNINTYFTTRATIIGEVLEEDGTPAALDQRDVSVMINNFVNYDQNPADTATKPATFCFLEPDQASGEYRGVRANQTTSGRFVLFRARNFLGTGTGMGEVRISGFPIGALNVSTGSIGFVRIRRGDGIPLPPRPRTFERDVYHYFADKTCSIECHRPNGVGYMVAPARPGSGGLTYRADWSASVDQVFDNLTKPFDTDCALGGATAARVCLAMPTASLLYQKPGGLILHAGLNLGTEDEMVVNILRWIEDGAMLR